MSSRSTLFIFLLFFSIFAFSQKSPERIARNANVFFEDNMFSDALPLYLQIKDNCPLSILSEDELAYRTAICYFNNPVTKYEAVPFFEKYVSTTRRDSNFQAHYLLAQLYQEQLRFDDALKELETFRKFVDLDSISDKQTIRTVKEILDRRIKNCNYGKLVYSVPREVIIENVRDPLNTEYSEYAPVITPDETKMVFTRRSPTGTNEKVSPDGDYYEDVYVADIQEGSVMRELTEDTLRAGFINVLKEFKFSEPVGLSNINTSSYDGAVQFSYSGSDLYVYRKNNVWISRYKDGVWQKPEVIAELSAVLDPGSFEPSVSIASDGNAIYFSSDRSGGYGGLDLYRAFKKGDGTWSVPENLGSSVNTAADEDSPYIDPDNKTLYFSSKGHSSMGGYDVFKAIEYKGRFTEVMNLGYPVNSPGDDIFFMMTPKYNRAYYASDKSGGKGKMDIYRITFANERKTFAEVKGLVLTGDKLVPAKSRISLHDPATNRELFTVNSDSITGDYLLLVGHNKRYEMLVQTEGFVPYRKEVGIPAQKDFFQYYQEVHHVYLRDKEGNIIGQLITMYTTNGDKVSVAKDSVYTPDFKQEEIKKPFISSVISDLDDKAIREVFKGNQELLTKFDNSPDKRQLLYDHLTSLPDDSLKNIIARNEALMFKARQAMVQGYQMISDAKFYISEDSLVTLMKTDPNLRFNFPKNTSVSFFDIRKAKGKYHHLNPDFYVISSRGLEHFSAEKLEPENVTTEKLKEVFSVKSKVEMPSVIVLFEFKGNDLSEEARQSLNVFADFMKQNPKMKFEIIGHTDSIGTLAFNDRLSLTRARTVSKYLQSVGVKTSQIRTSGKGETTPIVPNTNPDGSDNEEGRRLNRRVEFLLKE